MALVAYDSSSCSESEDEALKEKVKNEEFLESKIKDNASEKFL